jgi:hypothetical protein
VPPRPSQEAAAAVGQVKRPLEIRATPAVQPQAVSSPSGTPRGAPGSSQQGPVTVTVIAGQPGFVNAPSAATVGDSKMAPQRDEGEDKAAPKPKRRLKLSQLAASFGPALTSVMQAQQSRAKAAADGSGGASAPPLLSDIAHKPAKQMTKHDKLRVLMSLLGGGAGDAAATGGAGAGEAGGPAEVSLRIPGAEVEQQQQGQQPSGAKPSLAPGEAVHRRKPSPASSGVSLSSDRSSTSHAAHAAPHTVTSSGPFSLAPDSPHSQPASPSHQNPQASAGAPASTAQQHERGQTPQQQQQSHNQQQDGGAAAAGAASSSSHQGSIGSQANPPGPPLGGGRPRSQTAVQVDGLAAVQGAPGITARSSISLSPTRSAGGCCLAARYDVTR